MAEFLFAPAKLTRTLKVKGVRPDSMHEIESEMISLSFGDTLVLSGGSGITVVDAFGWAGFLESGVAQIPTDRSNLISRALEAVGQTKSVVVHKRIPPGAGLGGGSSDAAAILRYFRGSEGTREAGTIGADVTFCVRGGRAFARGIGDLLEPMPFRDESFVLLISPFGVPTAEVYKRFDLAGNPNSDSPNDLEAAAVLVEPRLRGAKERLWHLSGIKPILAGSGSTYFVEGNFEAMDIAGSPIISDGFRYIDLLEDGIKYRLVEASAIPPLT